MSQSTPECSSRRPSRIIAAIAFAIVLFNLHGCDRVHRLLDEQLVYQVNRNDLRGAYFCLLAGADANAHDSDGSSVLHLTVASGQAKTAMLLLDAGAQVNARRKNGATPLHLAVRQKELVERLLAKGAEGNAQDNSGKTPLMVAAAIGKSHVVDLLIADGAPMEARVT